MTPELALTVHAASELLFKEYGEWAKRGFSAPSPHFIKQACLIRNSFPNATWVETGTYLGQTTELLAKMASFVYSLEPEPTLYSNAKKLFQNHGNVEVINAPSEKAFPGLLPKINGDVNFWLDGHYSEGVTFKGEMETPIVEELRCITTHLKRFGHVCVLVDDIRCFNPRLPQFSGYPSVDYLVDWAKENSLNWHIEHDIFIAKN